MFPSLPPKPLLPPVELWVGIVWTGIRECGDVEMLFCLFCLVVCLVYAVGVCCYWMLSLCACGFFDLLVS